MTKHLLIIDDEASIRDLLNRYLTGLGYKVTMAEGVRTALKSIQKEPPDLIITDLQLEDGDGLEMIDNLKAMYAKIPVILLTGILFDSEVVEQVLANRVARYLKKTTPLHEIKECIERVLEITADLEKKA
jgi:DNA-binding NtrC family response regulator